MILFFLGEALLITEFVLAIRAIFGLEWLTHVVSLIIGLFTDLTQVDESFVAELLADWTPRLWYYGQVALLILRIVMLPRQLEYRNPFTKELTGDVLSTKATRWGLLILLAYRISASILLWLPLGPFSGSLTMWDVISDGCVMAIVTSDMILAKMALRNLHPWVPVMYMVSFLNRLLPAILVLFYFTGKQELRRKKLSIAEESLLTPVCHFKHSCIHRALRIPQPALTYRLLQRVL